MGIFFIQNRRSFPARPDGSARGCFFESRVQLSRHRSSRVSKACGQQDAHRRFGANEGRAAFGAPRPQRLKKCLHNKQAPFGQYASGRTPPAASRAGPSTRANRGTAYRKRRSDGLELGVGRVPPQAVQQNRQSGKVPEQNDQEAVRRRQPKRPTGDCVFVDCHTTFLIQVVKVQPRGVPRQQGEQRKQNRPLVSAVRFGNHCEEVKHQQNRRCGSGTKRQRNREGAAGRVPQKQRQKQRAGGRNADDRRNPAGAEAVLRLSAEQIKQRGEGGQQQKPQDGLRSRRVDDVAGVPINGGVVQLPKGGNTAQGFVQQW